MANHKSAQKATRQAAKRTIVNRNRMSRIRTFVKKVELLTPGAMSNEDALAALHTAEGELMRGVSKGLLHKNTVSRKVSRLAKMVKKLATS
jgi:small subunit ribosomal protein S20